MALTGKFPLSALYGDRAIAVLVWTADGANLPTIVVQDGFDDTHTHTGGTGVYGFALRDSCAYAYGITIMNQAAASTQYFMKTDVNASTGAVTVTAVTEAGVATQVTSTDEIITIVYCLDNPLL